MWGVGGVFVFRKTVNRTCSLKSCLHLKCTLVQESVGIPIPLTDLQHQKFHLLVI